MTKIALVYDADYTLMDGYHPSIILEKRGIPIGDFWKMVAHTQKIEKERGEKTSLDIIYLAHFMHEIRNGRLKGLTLRDLHEWGKEINKWFYPGIPEFFDEIKKVHPTCTISNNVISVGIKPILTSALGKYMDNIFGYTFFDDLTPGDTIDEIKSTSSSVEKIPAIVSISYGSESNGYDFPIRNLVYIGDGQTDIPAFRFVRKRGGLSICVYNPHKEGAFDKAMKLKEHVHYVLPADYSTDKALFNIVSSFIEARSKDPIVNVR